jgi:hypothetical protein
VYIVSIMNDQCVVAKSLSGYSYFFNFSMNDKKESSMKYHSVVSGSVIDSGRVQTKEMNNNI